MTPYYEIDYKGENVTEYLEQFTPEISWTDSVDDEGDELGVDGYFRLQSQPETT